VVGAFKVAGDITFIHLKVATRLVFFTKENNKTRTDDVSLCDVDQPANTKDSLHIPNGPITRSKAKALKVALNGLVVQVSAKLNLGIL
jgi:hypothetical protein